MYTCQDEKPVQAPIVIEAVKGWVKMLKDYAKSTQPVQEKENTHVGSVH